MLAADVPAGGQGAVTGLAGQRPLPCQELRFPAAPGRPSPGIRQPDTGPTSRLRAFWPASDPARPLPGHAGLGGAANLAHQQLIGGDQRERRPRRDHPARRRRSATATFAARLATLPITSSARGSISDPQSRPGIGGLLQGSAPRVQ